MRIVTALLFLFALSFSATAQQENDCIQKVEDLKDQDLTRVDTFKVRSPETGKIAKKVTHLYIYKEIPIAKQERRGNKTIFWVRKDDCLKIRHINTLIEQ